MLSITGQSSSTGGPTEIGAGIEREGRRGLSKGLPGSFQDKGKTRGEGFKMFCTAIRLCEAGSRYHAQCELLQSVLINSNLI